MRNPPARSAPLNSRQVDPCLARPSPHCGRCKRALALHCRCRCRSGCWGRCRLRCGDWLGFRSRIWLWFSFLSLALHFENNKFCAYRDHVARLAGGRDHLAAHGGRNRDSRLVGHQVYNRLVLRDRIASLYLPVDNLPLNDTFADIRQLEHVLAHFSCYPSCAKSIPSLAPGLGSTPTPECGEKECPSR